MIVYHRTSEENWAKIQEEGQLWGRQGKGMSRVTYVAYDQADTEGHGDVLLSFEFDPEEYKPNNHMEGAWQCRIYAPILLENITVEAGYINPPYDKAALTSLPTSDQSTTPMPETKPPLNQQEGYERKISVNTHNDHMSMEVVLEESDSCVSNCISWERLTEHFKKSGELKESERIVKIEANEHGLMYFIEDPEPAMEWAPKDHTGE